MKAMQFVVFCLIAICVVVGIANLTGTFVHSSVQKDDNVESESNIINSADTDIKVFPDASQQSSDSSDSQTDALRQSSNLIDIQNEMVNIFDLKKLEQALSDLSDSSVHELLDEVRTELANLNRLLMNAQQDGGKEILNAISKKIRFIPSSLEKTKVLNQYLSFLEEELRSGNAFVNPPDLLRAYFYAIYFPEYPGVQPSIGADRIKRTLLASLGSDEHELRREAIRLLGYLGNSHEENANKIMPVLRKQIEYEENLLYAGTDSEIEMERNRTLDILNKAILLVQRTIDPVMIDSPVLDTELYIFLSLPPMKLYPYVRYLRFAPFEPIERIVDGGCDTEMMTKLVQCVGQYDTAWNDTIIRNISWVLLNNQVPEAQHVLNSYIDILEQNLRENHSEIKLGCRTAIQGLNSLIQYLPEDELSEQQNDVHDRVIKILSQCSHHDAKVFMKYYHQRLEREAD